MTDNTWTDDGLADLNWSEIDALEIAGCVDLGDAIERVERAEDADFFSVYVHRSGEGVEAVADRNTIEEAEAFALELSRAHDLPLHRFY